MSSFLIYEIHKQASNQNSDVCKGKYVCSPFREIYLNFLTKINLCFENTVCRVISDEIMKEAFFNMLNEILSKNNKFRSKQSKRGVAALSRILCCKQGWRM